jgi:hypothetical protein
MDDGLTPYERNALKELQEWRATPPSPLTKAIDVIGKPIEKVGGKLFEQHVVNKVAGGIMESVLDGSHATLSEERVLDAYRNNGYKLDRLEDIRHTVPLEAMDRQALKLGKYYRNTMAAEGAGSGWLSGIPVVGVGVLAADILAVTTVGMRAATHHALTYGYRVETPQERRLVLSVLNGATSPDLVAKQTALAEVAKVAKLAAQKKTWEQLEKSMLVKALQQAAKQLNVRLTKAKLGQLMTGVGAFVGAGYNGWYMGRLGEWGYNTYRELHINTKRDAFGEQQRNDDEGPDDDIPDADVID